MCICRNNENIEMVPGRASKAGQFQQGYTNSQGLNLSGKKLHDEPKIELGKYLVFPFLDPKLQ